MNALIETNKPSRPTRSHARRIANWSVLLVALSHVGCDEDPDAWLVIDGGVDASVTADGGTQMTSTEDEQSQTSTLPVDTFTVGGPTTEANSLDAGGADASSTEPTGPDASATESDKTTVSTGETLVSSSDEVATGTSGPTAVTGMVSDSSEPTSAPNGTQTSAPTTGETSAPETSSEVPDEPTDAGVPDSATPPLEVCGAVIDNSEGISLAQALENYTIPDGGAWDGGDGGGALADCYPPCIAALLNACPVTSSQCIIDAEYNACWNNGVSQTQTYDYTDPYALVLTEDAYNGSAPCISGTITTDLSSFVSTYVWRDGTGAEVATGTDESEELVVTCSDTNESYIVDRYGCPELGQIVYTQFSCEYPSYQVR